MAQTILSELKDLVNQIGSGCCEPPPCCPQASCQPCTFPFAQVTMTCPPPCLAPTQPQPVKPLQLPCPQPPPKEEMRPEDREKFRYDNFYNNYNVDWHPNGDDRCRCPPCCTPEKQRGQTYDGKSPCCEDYTKKPKDEGPLPGCPTGFKPCTMKLSESCGTWTAQVQPCPPKPKKKNDKYAPGPCTKKCCKHWKPKEGPCLYDRPCKAHCFNHPKREC